jgi:hypothetical protein
MNLRDGDTHILFNDTTNKAYLWQKGGPDNALFEWEMRNDTVRRWFLHWGWCPRGDYLLGAPSSVHGAAYGYWFVPLFDVAPNGPMHKGGRSGIGIHGGGSGLPNPYADRQGWVPTHGCLRVQNGDLAVLVRHARECQLAGHQAYITVAGTAGVL